MLIKNTNRAPEGAAHLRVLVIEPYYGGSHKIFLNELKRHLPSFEFLFLTLPPRKWKWRMRMGAPWCAGQLPARRHVDVVLCSTFVDVAALRGLGPGWLHDIPVLTYFHENQFAYPVQKYAERDFHFGLINYLSALASDGLAFNSQFNLSSFLKGCRGIEGRCPDMDLDLTPQILDKSQVLYPGMDFAELDAIPDAIRNDVTTFVWNHRWEHDKNPEGFFEPFFKLHKKQIPFKLIVLGQSFQRNPPIFAEAQARLGSHMTHYGYVEDRSEYLALLKKGDVVVSTANHEFYGMSVIEAVRAGCRPLLPKRLSYPELFPAEFLYKSTGDLYQKIRGLCIQADPLLPLDNGILLTEQFGWPELIARYQQWFEQVV